jgi:predicted Zn-dependent protease with MMP-like domain
MADPANPESFEEIVEWAYSTLPQKIRHLRDFPGIQVVDEPPADVLEDISNRMNGVMEQSYWGCTAADLERNSRTPK